MPRRAVFIGVCAAALTVSVLGQTREPVAFEVVSVKRNVSAATNGGTNFLPGGRFVARNTTVRALIRGAFGDPQQLDLSRMSGGPSWIDTDRFDIEARASAEFPDLTFNGGFSATGAAMVRALLEQRFHIVTHWEEREVPVYLLTTRGATPRLVSSAGKPGIDCLPPEAAASPNPELPRCGSYLLQNTGGNQFAIHARGITMATLAEDFQSVAGRVVLDRTMLAGRYSFDLVFEYRPLSPTTADDGLGASVFAAVEEQLGLKLQPATAPLDVLVIDHVEQPTAD